MDEREGAKEVELLAGGPRSRWLGPGSDASRTMSERGHHRPIYNWREIHGVVIPCAGHENEMGGNDSGDWG